MKTKEGIAKTFTTDASPEYTMAVKMIFCKCDNEMIQIRDDNYSSNTKTDADEQLIFWCDKCGNIFDTNVHETDSSENPKGAWYMI